TNVVTGSNVDFSGGFSGLAQSNDDFNPWAVQAGDLLMFGNGGSNASSLYRIASVDSATQLTVDRAGTQASTSSYSILRGPRLRIGEAPLELPKNIIIDLTTNRPVANGGFGNPMPARSWLPAGEN